MLKKNAVETILGAVVLLMAGTFISLAMNMVDVGEVNGYEVSAAFLKVGGLTDGSDVRLNGVKIGTVSDLSLDYETYDAVVKMSIRSDIRLPVDSVASIGSSGIIGGKFIAIRPGGEKDVVAEGGALAKTEDFKSLEDQVGEIIFLATGG